MRFQSQSSRRHLNQTDLPQGNCFRRCVKAAFHFRPFLDPLRYSVANGPNLAGTLVAPHAVVTLLLTAALVMACDSPTETQPQCVGDDPELCWTHLGLSDEWVTSLAATPWGTFAGTADHGVFRLETDGSWTGLGPEAWFGRLYPSALLYVPADPPRLLAGVTLRQNGPEDTASALVFASYDRGATWSPSYGGEAGEAHQPHSVFTGDLAIDPGDPSRIYLAACMGVLRSLDAGETWRFLFGSYDFCAWNNDILIDPDRTGRIWVGGQGNLFNPLIAVTDDWGQTWTGGTPTCGGTVYETPVYGVALDPTIPGRVWAGVNGGVWWSDNPAARDSWHCTSPDGPRGDVNGFAVFREALYATTVQNFRMPPDSTGPPLTDLGLYRTTDGGATWDSLAVPDGISGAAAVIVDSANNRLLMGGREGGAWAVSILDQ